MIHFLATIATALLAQATQGDPGGGRRSSGGAVAVILVVCAGAIAAAARRRRNADELEKAKQLEAQQRTPPVT